MIRLSADEAEALDAFCESQEPRPSRSEAIRKLALHALSQARAGSLAIEWEGMSAIKSRAVKARWERRNEDVERKLREMEQRATHVEVSIVAPEPISVEPTVIRERIRYGGANAGARPERLGRPLAVYDRTRAAEMRTAGASYGMIARALGVPKSTIVEGLRNAETK